MFISVVSPCFNEEGNVLNLYNSIKKNLSEIGVTNYEHIFIDNSSNDKTVEILKSIAVNDKNLKIIVNSKNFGHIRSPYYGILQATGDAVVFMASDFQDPPELIKNFILKWKEGYKIVVGIKNESKENKIFFNLRKLYYYLLNRVSENELIANFTGFGLYDRIIIENMKKFKDPYPYFRGIVTEIGFERFEIPFVQPMRKSGKTKNNLITLLDIAICGFVNHSRLPLRLAIIMGFVVAILDLIIAFIYFIYKLLNWYQFEVGMPTLIIGMFFFAAVQLIFIGVVGEYIGAIYLHIKDRPLVFEKERINF